MCLAFPTMIVIYWAVSQNELFLPYLVSSQVFWSLWCKGNQHGLRSIYAAESMSLMSLLFHGTWHSPVLAVRCFFFEFAPFLICILISKLVYLVCKPFSWVLDTNIDSTAYHSSSWTSLWSETELSIFLCCQFSYFMPPFISLPRQKSSQLWHLVRFILWPSVSRVIVLLKDCNL